ncbi:TRAP transporter substrate-binding protein [Alkalicoccus daliensis]|uniref:TRAP-type C4-dicarboxylate transport system, substrate-binding protein n=1 Tax=Alkalicoccus daliensis TaxID=745820 RepID=A0A1H0EXJ9_9BACI|nr:TRAP transporter substrate-binding protein [Alkalicoccus daliensis]SDN87063.1 TRAP-type C4-dicarboxylate transport system, substrate-binding protein [Alkalicoccus daliensis]
MKNYFTNSFAGRSIQGLFIVGAGAMLVGCNGDGNNDEEASAGQNNNGNQAANNESNNETGDAEVSLVAATINPGDALLAQALTAFAEEINEESNGEIEVTVHTGGQVGDASSLYQSVISGDIDIIYSDSGWFAEHEPVFDVLATNYLFEDQEHFETVVNEGDSLSYFEDLLRENPGLETVMYAGGLERNIISTFPIESHEDLQGEDMRSGGSATEMEWWRSLGANPTTIDFNEVYTAIQTGVVDGSQNSLDAMIEQRFGEVADYVARTQHNLTLGFVVMNGERFEELDEEHKEAISRASETVQPEYIQMAFEQAEEDMETLETEFDITFTNPDREAFIEISREQMHEIAEEHGVVDEMEEIFN